MLEGETLNDPEFNWWEKRLPLQKTTTVAGDTGDGPFGGSDATTAAWGTTSRTGGAGIDAGAVNAAGDQISIKVADRDKLRVGHVIRIKGVLLDDATTQDCFFKVAQMNATAGWIDCYFINVLNDAMANTTEPLNNGLEVLVVGSGFAQGATGPTDEIYALPINPANYAQIFRTPFSISGTAVHTDAKYDSSGPYKDKAKDHSVQHMIELEKAFLFGDRGKYTISGVPTYFTGGIMWYLYEWEKANGGTYLYRNGGAAVTLDTEDDKRIITNSGGSLNHKTYNGYVERAFRVTNNVANEKLVLCGSGFLSVINQMYANKTTLTNQQGTPSTYGMTVVQHDTPFGTIYYKSHPLFSQDPILRYNALFVDVQNLRYRYIEGRDTQLLKNRQNNGDDFRRDEWLTEAGLELRFPESFMYLQNVQDFTP
jgi:hypothetical protein